MDLDTARRMVGPTRDTLAKAVIQRRFGLCEEAKLSDTVSTVAEFLAERGWEDGFTNITDAHVVADETDYGTAIGLGVSATAERKETMRQWCYQFVRLAERVISENKALRARMKRMADIANGVEEEQE